MFMDPHDVKCFDRIFEIIVVLYLYMLYLLLQCVRMISL